VLYFVEIAVPAQTPELTPLETRIGVTSGLCREQWFMFPDGLYGLTHLQVWHHGWQVWPWTGLTSFHWNNYVYHTQDSYPLTAEPYEFVVKCWNDDDSYLHHVTVALVIDPLPPSSEMAELSQFLEELGLGA